MTEPVQRKPAKWPVVLGAIAVGLFILWKLFPLAYHYKGPLLLLLAGALILWLHKRNFDRTNAYGVEEYKGFGHLVGHKTIELIVSLLVLVIGVAGFLFTIALFGGMRI